MSIFEHELLFSQRFVMGLALEGLTLTQMAEQHNIKYDDAAQAWERIVAKIGLAVGPDHNHLTKIHDFNGEPVFGAFQDPTTAFCRATARTLSELSD